MLRDAQCGLRHLVVHWLLDVSQEIFLPCHGCFNMAHQAGLACPQYSMRSRACVRRSTFRRSTRTSSSATCALPSAPTASATLPSQRCALHADSVPFSLPIANLAVIASSCWWLKGWGPTLLIHPFSSPLLLPSSLHAQSRAVRPKAVGDGAYLGCIRSPLETDSRISVSRHLLCALANPTVPKPGAAQAVVDDSYLGYISVPELLGLLSEALAASASSGGAAAAALAVYRALVAECLACRAPAIVDVGLAQLALADEAWTCPRVVQEALSVGQDPDCRGQARPAGFRVSARLM